MPYQELMLGYIYTQNSNASEHKLQEYISWEDCSGLQVVWPKDIQKVEDKDDKTLMMMELEPGDTDLMVFLHIAPVVNLRVKSRVVERKLSPKELRDATDKLGDCKTLPRISCTFKSLRTPHYFGVLL